MSHDKHHILVDDLTSEKLQQLKGDGYSPACVIESSPKNFQAIITIPATEEDSEKDRTAANKLTRELNLKYGDPKLSGSVHGHRLPPFPNCKPKHRREDGTYPNTVLVEAHGRFCEKARKEIETLQSSMKDAEKRARTEPGSRTRTKNYFIGASDSNAAYWAHYRDIVSRSSGAPDYSAIDGKIGIRMRVTGYSASQIRSAIETNAPAMRREAMTQEEYDAKYRNRNWGRYAQETTDRFVFGVRGMAQYERSREYRPRLMKVEGRDWKEESKREWEMRAERQRQEEKMMGR
jgi:hypothetical protein